ncbi:methyltransferase domain-containing protein [Domibacillus sp. 8LH]|uniref:class I SAM-dependent methyltransferase n=1 Tax=Domibacillus sp. 8LH TaxID=3073900 RepID=UPI0031748F66
MQESTETAKQRVKSQFGKSAEHYVTSSTHSTGTDLALLPEWLEIGPDSLVLDIATGGGHAAKALAPHAAHVFATDLTVPMLEAAQKHLASSANNIFYVAADAEALPFLPHTFDAVTCRIAAHHFPNPRLFVQEAARVLKPGGRFVLIDNIAPEDPALDAFVNRLESLRDHSHVRSYTIPEWKGWFQEAGFSLVKEQVRKKELGYPEWVHRTTASPAQVQEVDAHLLSSDTSVATYFSVKMQGESIASFQIDEWMAMVQRN